MSLQNTTKICFFFLGLLSVGGCAHNTGSPTDGSRKLASAGDLQAFCADPIRTICDGSISAGVATSQTALDLSADVKKRLNLSDADLGERSRLEDQIRYYLELEKRTGDRTSITERDLSGLVSETRAALLSALNSQSQLAPDVRNEMKEALNAVKFGSLSTLLKRPADIKSNLTTLTETCEGNGLKSNAALILGEESSTVLICPGFVLAQAERLKDKASALRAMQTVIAHEMGHSIDSAAFKKPYKELLNCLEPAMKEDSAGRKAKGRSVRQELVADYWSSLAQLSLARRNRQSPDDFVMRSKESYSFFCEPNSTEKRRLDHPSELNRIKMHAALPEIRAFLGCPHPLPEMPSCTLRGNSK